MEIQNAINECNRLISENCEVWNNDEENVYHSKIEELLMLTITLIVLIKHKNRTLESINYALSELQLIHALEQSNTFDEYIENVEKLLR